jgi:hypothetical protein
MTRVRIRRSTWRDRRLLLPRSISGLHAPGAADGIVPSCSHRKMILPAQRARDEHFSLCR